MATAYVTNSWTADTALPVLVGVPAGSNYGCNPSSVPGTISGVTATDTCSPAPVSVTGGAPVTNGCAVTQIFTITAVDGCGNTATAYVTNSWTADTALPVLVGVPAGSNYGCNPSSVPGKISGVTATRHVQPRARERDGRSARYKRLRGDANLHDHGG